MAAKKTGAASWEAPVFAIAKGSLAGLWLT